MRTGIQQPAVRIGADTSARAVPCRQCAIVVDGSEESRQFPSPMTGSRCRRGGAQ